MAGGLNGFFSAVCSLTTLDLMNCPFLEPESAEAWIVGPTRIEPLSGLTTLEIWDLADPLESLRSLEDALWV